LKVVKATPWDGREPPVVEEEEFSLEDIMAEEVRREGGREGGREGRRVVPLVLKLVHESLSAFFPTALRVEKRRELRKDNDGKLSLSCGWRTEKGGKPRGGFKRQVWPLGFGR
jgi:hypothetical protein